MKSVIMKVLAVTQPKIKFAKLLYVLRTIYPRATKSAANKSWHVKMKRRCTSPMGCAVDDTVMLTFVFTVVLAIFVTYKNHNKWFSTYSSHSGKK